MKNRVTVFTIKNLIAVLLAVLLCVSAAACGSGGGAPPETKETEETVPEQTPAVSPETETETETETDPPEPETTGYEVPEIRLCAFNEGAAEGDAEAMIDLSSAGDGYVALLCNSNARLKFQVFKDEYKFTYDVTQGKVQIYPLQCGSGHYIFRIMKNVEGNSYFELHHAELDVTIADEFDPFLRPSQYADYTESSKCVIKASEFAAESEDEHEFITKVLEFVCDTVTYDYDKAANIKSGYLPDPDETMETGLGICFDYASLCASMLRSQGIPTKIIFGYVAPDDLYHAWNMYYTKEDGWVAVEFETKADSWNRLDTTFLANGSDADFVGNGSNYADVYQY